MEHFSWRRLDVARSNALPSTLDKLYALLAVSILSARSSQISVMHASASS